MGDFQHIIWDPKYSVKVPAIDSQHQQLFFIMNRLIDTYEGGSSDLYPILKDLVDYLSKHFHAEQLLMTEMRFPRISAHMEEHQAFTDKVMSFLDKFKEQDRDLVQKMLLFLSNWIFTHTTSMDMQYAAHFQKTAGKI
jgi:hemerythrin